jgi:hypothetical protein
MNPEFDRQTDSEDGEPTAAAYEPPQVEAVLTAEELAREIQYAGAITVL